VTSCNNYSRSAYIHRFKVVYQNRMNSALISSLKAALNRQTLGFTGRSLGIRIAAMSTISDSIIKDHRELEEYYNEVINNPENHDHQQRFGNQFVWELARLCMGSAPFSLLERLKT
jgi:aromatic ring hydroxylase